MTSTTMPSLPWIITSLHRNSISYVNSLHEHHQNLHTIYTYKESDLNDQDHNHTIYNSIKHSQDPEENVVQIQSIFKQHPTNLIYVFNDIELCNAVKHAIKETPCRVILIVTQNTLNIPKQAKHFPQIMTMGLDAIIQLKNVTASQDNVYTIESSKQLQNIIPIIQEKKINQAYYACNIASHLKTSHKDLQRIIHHIINTKNPISFDIFDTLIIRPIWEPSDLFIHLKETAFTTCQLSSTFNIKNARIKAEHEARKRKPNQEDITIDDIYQTFAEYYEIDTNIAHTLMNAEIELEKKFCEPKPFIQSLYQLAVHFERDIYIVSDMYLTQNTIQQILEKNGYNHFKKIYMSSEYKKTKGSGNLYKVILEEHPEYKHAIHIGDNAMADIVKCPIQAIHTPSSMTLFQDQTGNLKVWNFYDKAFFHIRHSLAIIAHTLYNNPFKIRKNKSIFDNSLFGFGYYAIGLYITGLLYWTHEQCKNAKVDVLGCLARDGYMLYNAYNIFKSYTTDIPYDVLYLASSRFLSHKTHPPYSIILNPTRHLTYKSFVEFYLDIDYHDLPPEERYFKEDDYVTNDLHLLLQKHKNRINKSNTTETFYKKTLADYHNIALYDIGYGASSAIAISNAIKKPITNIFSQTNARYLAHQSQNPCIKDFKVFHPYLIAPHIIESFMSYYQEGTIKRIIEQDNQYRLEKSRENLPHSSHLSLRIIQQSALMFVEKFVSLFPHDRIHAPALFEAWQPLNYFVNTSREHSITRNISMKDPLLSDKPIPLTKKLSIPSLLRYMFSYRKLIYRLIPLRNKSLRYIASRYNTHNHKNNLRKYFYSAIFYLVKYAISLYKKYSISSIKLIYKLILQRRKK